MDNYKILLSLRILKNILNKFIDIFFVLYFLELSNSNILPLGVYNLVSMITVYIVIFMCRNFSKSKHRIFLLRIGIIFNLIYFLAIILLREKLVDYMYFVGILYGLEEGFYFSVYNVFASDGVSNEKRANFIGSYTVVTSIFAVIFPLIFGSAISKVGFLNTLSIVLVIVSIKIVLSYLYKDNNIPEGKKVDMKKFYSLVKDNKKVKQMLMVKVFDGLTYSTGALSYIVTIYTIRVFSTSISLGIFTSIFEVITCLIGILFAKCIKQKHYRPVIKVSMLFTVVSLCIMIYDCNMITVVLFNLFQTFSKNLVNLINEKSQFNISNIDVLKKEYKVEYWLSNETALLIGRVISNSLFVLMAFTNSNVIIYIFVLFLVFVGTNSIKLQKVIEEDNK